MTVWHGSSRAVATPDLLHARPNTDFGRGFYVTLVYEQAARWALRFNWFWDMSASFVADAVRHETRCDLRSKSRYSFDEAAARGLDVLRFASYSDEWLSFVLTCCTGCDTSSYDIVSGGVANDRVFNTLELYLDQLIDRGEALRRLQYEKPNEQLCLRTASALNLLHFEGSESV